MSMTSWVDRQTVDVCNDCWFHLELDVTSLVGLLW